MAGLRIHKWIHRFINYNPLIYRRVEILEKLQKEKGYRRRDNHCFSIVMYGFCSNNALCSACLSVTAFTFLLAPFNT